MGKRIEDKKTMISRFNIFLKELSTKSNANNYFMKNYKYLNAEQILNEFTNYNFMDCFLSYCNNRDYLKSVGHENLSKNFIDKNLDELYMIADDNKHWYYKVKEGNSKNESDIHKEKRKYLQDHICGNKEVITRILKIEPMNGEKINMKKIFSELQYFEGDSNVFGYTDIGNDMMIIYVKKGYNLKYDK